MTTFVLFLGGSGAMTAKAFAHLAAIGMVKNKNDLIHLQICDKDFINRDTEIADKLIGHVETLASSGFLNPMEGNGICDDKTCFTTHVKQDFFNFSKALEDVIRNNGGAANPDLPLGYWVKDDDLGRHIDQTLLDSFFTQEEQCTRIDTGFKGSACNGELIYSYLLENDDSVFREIKEYITVTNDHCKVFIVASAFGGTGTAMFLKTAERVKALAPDLIHVAGALILPYFNFRPDFNTVDPRSFWPKAMTVLRNYSDYPDLVKKSADDQKGILDRLYIAAQPNNEMHYCTIGTSEGGNDQMRRSDFIDVVTANYIVDFINAEPDRSNFCFALGDNNKTCSNIYTLKYPEVNPETPLTLTCIPELQESMTKMLKFSSIIFFLLWSVVRNEDRLKRVDWLRHLMGLHGGLFRGLRYPDEEVAEALNNVLGPVFEYCADFVDFAREIAENGRPTVDFADDFSANYYFFNKVSVRALWDVKNSLCGGATPCNIDLIVNALNCKDYCGTDLAQSAMDTLQNVDIRHLLKDNVSAQDAISAYINLIYKNL